MNITWCLVFCGTLVPCESIVNVSKMNESVCARFGVPLSRSTLERESLQLNRGVYGCKKSRILLVAAFFLSLAQYSQHALRMYNVLSVIIIIISCVCVFFFWIVLFCWIIVCFLFFSHRFSNHRSWLGSRFSIRICSHTSIIAACTIWISNLHEFYDFDLCRLDFFFVEN